ncbi:MAG: F420-nonreducing hydrogenase [Actinomycetota bacterium]|nr:F420-nonreducing hydrogenase [Actinomycetota bacterium]
MSKPRLAHVILGGCEGCYVSLLDAHEGLVDLLDLVDIVYSPLTDTGEMQECEVVIVEGAVTTEHDEVALREAREKAGTLVAVGSCAALGGIGGLRNLYSSSDVLESVFGEDQPSEELPKLTSRVHPLSDYVEVDISVPGCAPKTETILAALGAAIAGELFEMPRRNMCDECTREKVALLHHSAEFVSDTVYSLMELDEINPTLCFLEQGVICMGPMTREGCGARCITANVPCRGCQGPSRVELEQGAKMIDALAALLPPGAIMYLDDLIGTGYRYTLPISVFPAVYDQDGGDSDD